MPLTYEELLVEVLPERIEKDADYDRLQRRLSELMRLRKRSAADTELFHLLVLLVQDYDRRHALPPEEFEPAQLSQYEMEVSGKEPAELPRHRSAARLLARCQCAPEQAGI